MNCCNGIDIDLDTQRGFRSRDDSRNRFQLTSSWRWLAAIVRYGLDHRPSLPPKQLLIKLHKSAKARKLDVCENFKSNLEWSEVLASVLLYANCRLSPTSIYVFTSPLVYHWKLLTSFPRLFGGQRLHCSLARQSTLLQTKPYDAPTTSVRVQSKGIARESRFVVNAEPIGRWRERAEYGRAENRTLHS